MAKPCHDARDRAIAQFGCHDMTVQLPSRIMVRLLQSSMAGNGLFVNAFVSRSLRGLTGVEITLPDSGEERD